MPTKTFQEVARLWCEAKRPIVKYSTLCAYQLILHSHLIPYFGATTHITEATVQQFIVEKSTQGHLSKKSVRDIVAVLKAIVKFGHRHKSFPIEEWQLEYPTDTEPASLPVLSLRHQRVLITYLSEHPTPQTIGILIALCTGMRIGEVCALQWEDVDLRERLITVRQTVGRVYNCELRATERIVSSPKTKNAYREIPISTLLLRALKTVCKLSRSPFVVGASVHATEPRSYRDRFARLLKRLGLPHIVFHGLRHTFATRCIESQCDYKTVSVILGHANVATTINLYVHPSLHQKKRCIAKMSKFISSEE